MCLKFLPQIVLIPELNPIQQKLNPSQESKTNKYGSIIPGNADKLASWSFTGLLVVNKRVTSTIAARFKAYLLMGKGINMAKKKRKFKLQLTDQEKLLAKLHKAITARRLNAEDIKTGLSLIAWNTEIGRLTSKQWTLIKLILRRSVKLNKPLIGKQYLYAISDGLSVKLGFSGNIRKRITQLQVSNSRDLSLIWKYYIGKNRSIAKNLEKKLHNRCHHFKLRGEWFDLKCMKLVEKFKILL